MATSLMELSNYVKQGFEEGTARRKQNGLAALSANYAAGGQPDYQGIAANGGDPLAFRKDAQGQEDRGREEVGRMASMLLAAPVQMRPAMYRSFVPKLPSLGIPDAPGDYSPAMDEVLQAVAAQYGKGGDNPFKPMNVSPGGEIVDPRTGKVIHSNTNFAPQRPTWDSNRGGWVMPPGGQPSPQPQQQPSSQFSLDDAALAALKQIPPQERAAALQAMLTGGDFHVGNNGQAVQGASPGFMPVVAPKPDYEAERLRIAQEASARAASTSDAANTRAGEASKRADEAARRAALGTAPAGMRFDKNGNLIRIPGAPVPTSPTTAVETSAAGMAQDALNYAAAMLGKSPEAVGKMTPEAIRDAIANDPRLLTGPIGAGWWGSGKFANADLEAYANSAAGKKARLNNPTGPVSNADFEIGRKSVFSPEKPASVNADLIYQALTWKRGSKNAPQKAPPKAPDLSHLSDDELLKQLNNGGR